MSDVCFIYGLFDPRTPAVVMCVGKTRLNLSNRLSVYLSHANYFLKHGRRMCPSVQWVHSLRIAGVKPHIRLLATTDVKNWKACERRFISMWRKKNPHLLNVRSGGDGKEAGPPKKVCECGARRKQKQSGWYCPKCTLRRSRTAKARARQKAYREERTKDLDRLNKWRCYVRNYSKTPKQAAWKRRWYKKNSKKAKFRRRLVRYQKNYVLRHRNDPQFIERRRQQNARRYYKDHKLQLRRAAQYRAGRDKDPKRKARQAAYIRRYYLAHKDNWKNYGKRRKQ